MTTAHGQSCHCLAILSLSSVGFDLTVLAVGGCSDLLPFQQIRASHSQFRVNHLIHLTFRDMMHSASFISDACQHEAVAHVMYITSNQFNPSRAREIGGEIPVSIYNSLLLNNSIIWNLDLFPL